MIARTLAAFAGAACAVVVIALVPACSEEDIVLANLPPRADGGSPMGLTRCVDETECTTNEFCSRTSCFDVGGTCATRPTVCGDEEMPVCGCDGITYWNDCLRRTAGVTAMFPEECGMNGHRCSFSIKGGPAGPGTPIIDACPTDSFCALLFSFDDPQMQCPTEVHGKCWALPAVCPSEEGPDRWIPCGPSQSCLKTCDAIRKSEPHRRAHSCP